MEHFQIIKIKEVALKVNIHCDGCKHKVKKILKKIEGVYHVVIDAEQQQKVKVYGFVDSTTLINKLLKKGKYAQLWAAANNDYQEIPNYQIQNLVNAPKGQPMMTPKSVQDQMSFEKQGMDVKNMGGWDDDTARGGLIGENEPGFIDFEGSQLGGGLQTYQSMMNMYQQNHPSSMMINRNVHNKITNMHGSMENVMMHHDNNNMYMNMHAFPMFHHAPYY